MLQRLFVPSLCMRTEREAQGAVSKSTASALFSVLLQGIHGNEDDFPILFWGRHGIHCNTVSSTKILQNNCTGWMFFIQKACSTSAWRERAPLNPPIKPGISQQVSGSCFPAGFHGRGGQPASLADTKPFPKVPVDGGRWWAGVGRGEWRPWGKGVLREGNQTKYSPGFRSRAGLGMSGLKTAGTCEYVMPGVWQENLVLPRARKSLEVLKA